MTSDSDDQKLLSCLLLSLVFWCPCAFVVQWFVALA